MEKFKGFRDCFRKMDKDFSGQLNFREFVQGMDEIGFSISLSDYRILFDQMDYDQSGEIDYFKFCLLDYDKASMREKLNHEFNLQKLRSQDEQKQKYTQDNKVNLRYQDGNLPKNKDTNLFLSSVQQKSFQREFLEKKDTINANFQGIKTSGDMPNDHTYGVIANTQS